MRDFFENLLRFPRFFVVIILGIFYSVYEWFKPLLKNRITAIAFFGMLAAGFLFIFFTLRAMLGLATV